MSFFQIPWLHICIQITAGPNRQLVKQMLPPQFRFYLGRPPQTTKRSLQVTRHSNRQVPAQTLLLQARGSHSQSRTYQRPRIICGKRPLIPGCRSSNGSTTDIKLPKLQWKGQGRRQFLFGRHTDGHYYYACLCDRSYHMKPQWTKKVHTCAPRNLCTTFLTPLPPAKAVSANFQFYLTSCTRLQ